MKLIAALIATGVLTGAAVTAYQPLIDEALDVGAHHSVSAVARAALYDHLLTGNPWPQALADASQDMLQGAENTTVTGTTVRWVYDDYCAEATLPDPWAPVSLVTC